MSNIDEIVPLINQIREIEKQKVIIKTDNLDFNKEKHLADLSYKIEEILKSIAAIINSNGFNCLEEVTSKPSVELCNVLMNESNNLRKIRNNVMANNFPDGYKQGRSSLTDQIYKTRVKPLDDCIDKYNDMNKLVGLLNTPDNRFVEAMQVLYDKQVNANQVSTISDRLKILSETEMNKVIPMFYKVSTLYDKITDMPPIRSDYMSLFINSVTNYDLRPTLVGIDDNKKQKIEFCNLFSELYPVFYGYPKTTNSISPENTMQLGLIESNRLYDMLVKYCSLYEYIKKSEKVSEALSNVENNTEIKKMVDDYEALPKELLTSDEKTKYTNELNQLKKSKNPFNKKQRASRIQDIEALLSNDEGKIKKLDNRDTQVFNVYFNAIRNELEGKGILPKDISKFQTWDELKEDLKKEIINVMSNMFVDGATMKMQEVISETLFPFKRYVASSKDDMDNFVKMQHVNGNVDINKAMEYIKLRNSNPSIATPYNENNFADYFATSSWLRINEEYQKSIELEAKTVKM